MFANKSVARIFSVLLMAVFLLGSAPLPAQAQAVRPNANASAGLGAADWAQVKDMLPAAAPYTQQAYIKASNTGSSDWFGWSAAISGDTLVVGAPQEASNATGINGNQADNTGMAGAVYVFTRSGSAWSQQAYIKASNTNPGDGFGVSVAISGDTLVVGASSEDSSATGVNGNQADNSVTNSGAAYVFTRSGSTWSQQAYIKASNPGASDWFGWSIAISGDTLVVGANNEDSNATGVNGSQADNSATDSGAAYVFTRTGSTWSQQAYLKASNTWAGNKFGYAVTISGDTVAVGACLASTVDAPIISNTGAAYVFTRSGSNWSQQAFIPASNPNSNDNFGYSIAIAADTLVVGAPQEDSNVTGINGNQADNSAETAGAAYVFTRSGTAWNQQAYLKASNTDAGDGFGSSVAISGDTIVVDAIKEDGNATGVNGNQTDNSAADAGAAYVFTRSGSGWNQQAYIKASNTGASDWFGNFSAISGNTLVVSAGWEASNATGVNGNQMDNSMSMSGAAYVFILPPFVKNSLRTGASPTSAASVDFTVSFSENMTGVDASDFALTTTGDLNGASVTGVSGGPGTYTVTVGAGSGSGDLRLDVLDDDTILNAVSTPLGGVGLGNGNFTSGEAYTINGISTPTPTATETLPPTGTPTETLTATETPTPTATPTDTASPTGTMTITRTATQTRTPTPIAKTFNSIAAQDGWVLESSETGNAGGSVNSSATTFYLGDDKTRKQYRGILSFSTGAGLPDNTIITGVTLKVRQQAIVGGGNPVSAFGGFMFDIKKGFFGTAPALQIGDFQAAAGTAGKSYGPSTPAPVGGWYIINLTGAKAYVNKLSTGSGLTQIRLRFKLDDNNNAVANYLSLYSGNAPAGSQPQLVITYTIP